MPIDALKDFGEYGSTLSLDKIIPLTPSASAVREIAPRFDGSLRFSRAIYLQPFEIFVEISGIFTTAIIPCGEVVSLIFAKSESGIL